jgi:uncharacterized membrane protein YqaE (UPF0057 family)
MKKLLAVVCPPAAAYLSGNLSRAATNVGLTLLCYFPGVWHALSSVEKQQVRQRNEKILKFSEEFNL